ncbi:MAG: TolC family protein [Candidatus Aminicenantes bacterium]|nr:TolC family protein [Candidatus Aminicenantes bacterium]
MRRHVCISLVLIALGAVCICQYMFSALPEKAKIRLNLKECVARALKISPEIESEESKLGIAKAQYQETLSLKYLSNIELTNISTIAPAVNLAKNDLLDLGTRNDWTRVGLFNKFELKFIQPIYTFGRIRNSIEAARFGVEAQEKSISQKQNEITFRIIKLYYARLLAEELLGVVEEAKKIVNKAVSTLEEMLTDLNSSSVSETDLFRMRLFSYEIEKLYRDVVKEKTLTLSSLKLMLDYGDDVSFDVSDEFLEPEVYQILNLRDYKEMMIKCRPEIARLNAAVAAQNALKKVSQSLYYPQIFISGGTSLAFAPIRDDIKNPFLSDPWNYTRLGVVLGISLPLNFPQIKARIRKQEYSVEKIEAQKSATLNLFFLEVEKAYRNLINSKKDMEDNKKALRMSREWLTTEQITFDLDASNTKDLAEAVKEYIRVKTEYYSSIYQYNIAVAELKLVTGIVD